ncbi:hypothetical protein AcV5_003825, partial [Taiwanofungus camphoratus]
TRHAAAAASGRQEGEAEAEAEEDGTDGGCVRAQAEGDAGYRGLRGGTRTDERANDAPATQISLSASLRA